MPLFAIVFIVIVIVLIFRAVAAGSQARGGVLAPRSTALTEVADDGFWIVSCGANPDDVLQYHYWAGGVRRTGQIVFQPDQNGRQFVYTGVRPDQAAIIRILEAGDGPGSTAVPPIIAAESFFSSPTMDADDTPSAPSPPSNFPSAY